MFIRIKTKCSTSIMPCLCNTNVDI